MSALNIPVMLQQKNPGILLTGAPGFFAFDIVDKSYR
jgi:hypothetical protein